MAEKTCCVTGHRDIPEDRIAYVEQELRREVLAAIQDRYTRFISGCHPLCGPLENKK